MQRTQLLMMLVALAATTVACGENKPPAIEPQKKPAENKPEKSETTAEKPAEKPKKEIYFKNPSPPFEVELGKAEQESPAAEFLDSGHLRVPVLYREWIFVGSRLAAGSQPTFENYYMHPRHYQSFLKNHAWPHQIVLVRERFANKSIATDKVMGEPRGVSVAYYNGRADTAHGGWQFFDFGESYPLANTASPDGRPWFDSADALLEFCPVLRGIKR
jgi:hypothetical protein